MFNRQPEPPRPTEQSLGAIRPRSGRRAELRGRLVAAAEHLIEAQGLSAVKARTLADAAGCALGAIYTVFADLDAVVMAVSLRTLARLDRHLAPVLSDEGGPAAKLRLLALAYLDFAAAHPALWRALFEHRLPPGKAVPHDLVAEQTRLFAHVETLLVPLTAHMFSEARAMLARTLFSAVHGVVLLGLEEKLAPMPMPALRMQLSGLVEAMAAGIAASAPARVRAGGSPASDENL
jgi:AcrR family transcriptional regulator